MLLRKSLPQGAQEFCTFTGRTKIAVCRIEGALRDRHLPTIHLFSVPGRCTSEAMPQRGVGVCPVLRLAQ